MPHTADVATGATIRHNAEGGGQPAAARRQRHKGRRGQVQRSRPAASPQRARPSVRSVSTSPPPPAAASVRRNVPPGEHAPRAPPSAACAEPSQPGSAPAATRSARAAPRPRPSARTPAAAPAAAASRSPADAMGARQQPGVTPRATTRRSGPKGASGRAPSGQATPPPARATEHARQTHSQRAPPGLSTTTHPAGRAACGS